jgi:hypothetical protein
MLPKAHASLIPILQWLPSFWKTATDKGGICMQRYFIRIIILIPNYALCSFLSLVFQDAAVYILAARDMCASSRDYPSSTLMTLFLILSLTHALRQHFSMPGTIAPLNIHAIEVFLGYASPCLMNLFTPKI